MKYLRSRRHGGWVLALILSNLRFIGGPHAALAGATALLLGTTRNQMQLEGLETLKSGDHAPCHLALAHLGERACANSNDTLESDACMGVSITSSGHRCTVLIRRLFEHSFTRALPCLVLYKTGQCLALIMIVGAFEQ